MAGVTVEYVLVPTRARHRGPEPIVIKRPRPRGNQSLSKALALAHRIVDMHERGELKDYRAAAKHLNVTETWISKLVLLTLLAPDIQARVLVGKENISEATLRRALASLDWDEQRALLDKELS